MYRNSDFRKSIEVSPEQINSRKGRNASRDAKEYGNNGRNKNNGQDR